MRPQYRHPVWRSWCLALLAAGIASVAFAAAPIPLSLAEAVRQAHVHSFPVRGADARLKGAAAGIRGARALPNPTLTLAKPYGSTETAGFDEDVVLSQTAELPGKVGPRVHAAQAERDAAAANLALAELDVTLAVRTAYFSALRADVERALAADSLAEAEAFATAAQVQFQAGDAARSNVLRGEVETTRARQALDAADAERENRYAALRSLVGLPANAALELADKLEGVAFSQPLEGLQQRALRQRPDLAAAQRLREARSSDVSGARAAWQPDIFVEGRHSTLNPSTGGSSVRIGLTLPLLDLGRDRAAVASAKAALTEQQAALAESTRTATLEVDEAYRMLTLSQKSVESFRSGRLDRARELLEMAQTGYEHGASSYLELLDAQQIYRNEQADYARALADENTALATLEHAVGGPLT
ncbi:MAG TPA: TolC family protein [Armatimonadota bacterium]|jgi:outer membrane protein TolC